MSFGIFLSCSILRLLPPPAGWTKCPEVGRGGRAPGFGTLCPSGGVARKADFILPLAAGNGKSLTTPYPCPGAGCGSAPVCGGPCKRCCLPLLKMGEKMTVLRDVPGERSGCRFWFSDPPNRYSRANGCIGSAGTRGKRRKTRKGARVAGGDLKA